MAGAPSLGTYKNKRNFRITPEPPGDDTHARTGELMFVVQKHDARRLHYDFRLEWNGVLLSWAVPKGPSYAPENKRLAMRTEDHPLSYGDFEGIIPENQYGAGPVMVWDTGRWFPLSDNPQKDLDRGKLTFRLEGEKLRGVWTLARMHTEERDRESWLLIKAQDENALPESEDADFLQTTNYSVKTGRAFKDIAAGKAKSIEVPTREGLARLQKEYSGVQLASLVENPPEGEGWVHEVKYDGYRIFVTFVNGTVRILTRRGHNWTDKFPRLRDAFQKLETGSFVIDGEAVVINEKGLSDFKSLQNGLGNEDTPMQGYFFDLLHLNGKDYRNEPFEVRRQALEELFRNIPQDPLYLSETIEGKAGKIIDKACDLGLEGIISKKKNARYEARRSKSWLKSKCVQRQEFIICGFVPSTDIPDAVGALHLGIYKNEQLVYTGKVGTGFDRRSARNLFGKLEKKRITKPPFDKPVGRHKDTIWVRPEVLCEVKFGMWTQTGKIRHASYQGLREDKAPEEITQEKPLEEESISGMGKRKNREPAPKVEIEGVAISNPDREIFPQAHITKTQLAAFYGEMADMIVPEIKDRPISVVRCPGGIDKQCFFQRSKGKGMPDHIYVIDMPHKGKAHDYIYIREPRGLIELVQMGVIEVHGWGVKIDKPEKPDRIIFDIDPAENVPFEAVKLAAQDIRRRLDNLGLTSFLKCTGGKGLHVTIPILRQHGWDTVKPFAKRFADRMVKDVPEAYTVNMAKNKRSGKIFIDYLRNDFSATAVMDYCVRARPGAAVAVPLRWDDLDSLESASQFTMDDVRKRREQGELFTYPQVRQGLTKDILAAL